MIRPMRPVVIAANWKMHTTPADAGELARTIAARTAEPGVTRVICPPFVCLAAVRDALVGVVPPVAVGAQNMHHERAGAFTGEVSAAMLRGLAEWVIIGHSERRRDAGETDEVINRKVRRAQEALLHVRRGRKLAPTREKPYLFLGRLHHAAGRIDAAEKCLTRALQLDPDCVEAMRELRLIQMRRKKARGLVDRLLRR